MSDPLSPPAPPPAGEEPSLLKQMWPLLPLPWSRICQPPGLPGLDKLRHLRKLPFVLEVSHQALGAQLADHLLPRPPWLAEDKGPSTSWTRGQGCGEGSQMSCLQSAGAPGKEGRSPRGPQSGQEGSLLAASLPGASDQRRADGAWRRDHGCLRAEAAGKGAGSPTRAFYTQQLKQASQPATACAESTGLPVLGGKTESRGISGVLEARPPQYLSLPGNGSQLPVLQLQAQPTESRRLQPPTQ